MPKNTPKKTEPRLRPILLEKDLEDVRRLYVRLRVRGTLEEPAREKELAESIADLFRRRAQEHFDKDGRILLANLEDLRRLRKELERRTSQEPED